MRLAPDAITNENAQSSRHAREYSVDAWRIDLLSALPMQLESLKEQLQDANMRAQASAKVRPVEGCIHCSGLSVLHSEATVHPPGLFVLLFS